MPDGFAPTALVGGPDLSVPQKDARVIVVGNEKGGAGKSTVSMHLCVSLMRMGRACLLLNSSSTLSQSGWGASG